MKFKAYILFFLCTLPFFGCQKEASQAYDLTGQKLPSFHLRDSAGVEFYSTSLAGNPSIIVFFHTECPDCQRELPILQQVYDTYSGQVKFLLISREQKESEIAEYWSSHQLSMPYFAQTDRSIYHLFAKSGIPRIYLVDANLQICKTFDDKTMPDFHTISQEIDKL